MRQPLVIATLLLLIACDGSDRPPGTPTPPPFATGTWQGPYTSDSGLVAGSVRLVLTHASNGQITGMATLTVPGTALPSGNVTGGVQPGATPPVDVGLAITVAGACPATLSAPSRFTSTTALEGKIAGGNPQCGLDVSGGFVLQKQ